ncbi:TroA family protein [Pseudonocardia adelaidensis]|uniref:Uncharacterized protein n=1 Tax=Pseudonocardia adelaidensis TaxID=648754 RepID=A0ABP9NF69_9PSEU
MNWKQDSLLLADGLGREGAARAFLDDFAADAAQVGERVGEDTVSFVRVTADRTPIFGVASFTGFIVRGTPVLSGLGSALLS